MSAKSLFPVITAVALSMTACSEQDSAVSNTQTSICELADTFSGHMASLDFQRMEKWNFFRQTWETGLVETLKISCDASQKTLAFSSRTADQMAPEQAPQWQTGKAVYRWKDDKWVGVEATRNDETRNLGEKTYLSFAEGGLVMVFGADGVATCETQQTCASFYQGLLGGMANEQGNGPTCDGELPKDDVPKMILSSSWDEGRFSRDESGVLRYEEILGGKNSYVFSNGTVIECSLPTTAYMRYR